MCQHAWRCGYHRNERCCVVYLPNNQPPSVPSRSSSAVGEALAIAASKDYMDILTSTCLAVWRHMLTSDPSLETGFVVLISILAITYFILPSRFHLPPGPKGLLVLGNIFQFTSLPWYQLTKWKDQYGESLDALCPPPHIIKSPFYRPTLFATRLGHASPCDELAQSHGRFTGPAICYLLG